MLGRLVQEILPWFVQVKQYNETCKAVTQYQGLGKSWGKGGGWVKESRTVSFAPPIILSFQLFDFILICEILIFTARKRSLGQGNIFTPVCHSVHGGAYVVVGGACMVTQGGVHGCSKGGCAWFFFWGRGCAWFFPGGHAWLLPGGMCGCSRGACMVFSGGIHGFFWGHAWFFWWGVCMVFSGWRVWSLGGGACIGYDEIRSMSGQYASYWNAFLSLSKKMMCYVSSLT